MDCFSGKNFEDKVGMLLFALGLIFLFILTCTSFKYLTTWYDSNFSIYLAQLPLNQFFVSGVNDVHPLFYYFLLKIFFNIFAVFNITNTVFIGKILSLIPIYLLVILSYFKIKKHFGFLAAGIFTFCIVSMPYIPKFALDIRMYSWALFFATASFIYIIEIINENKIKNWLMLIVLTVLGSSTHYFAALSIFCLYVVFFVYILFRNRDLLKRWILSVVCSILLYSPWFPYLLIQLHSGKNGFWVGDLTASGLLDLYYIFSPVSHEQLHVLGGILIIAIIAILIYNILNKKENLEFIYMGISTFWLVILISIIFTYTVFPIFTIRFLFPVFGCLWLAVAILLSNVKDNRKLLIIIVVIILLVGSVSLYNRIDFEQTRYDETLQLNQTVQGIILPNDTVIYNDNISYIEFSSYCLRDCNNIFCSDFEEIKSAINETNASNIYFISINDDFANNCSMNNVSVEEVHSYNDPLIMNYKVTIYRLIN